MKRKWEYLFETEGVKNLPKIREKYFGLGENILPRTKQTFKLDKFVTQAVDF